MTVIAARRCKDAKKQEEVDNATSYFKCMISDALDLLRRDSGAFSEYLKVFYRSHPTEKFPYPDHESRACKYLGEYVDKLESVYPSSSLESTIEDRTATDTTLEHSIRSDLATNNTYVSEDLINQFYSRLNTSTWGGDDGKW